MKTFATFFSSLSLLLGACEGAEARHVSPTPLPIYQNKISDINLKYEGDFLTGDIVLSDKIVLHINDYKTRNDTVMGTWHKGDVVFVDSTIKNDVLILSLKRRAAPDADKVEPYVVYDVVASPKTGLQIHEIRDNGKFIKLSDDSVWNFSWYNTLSTREWAVGQNVIVSGPTAEGCNCYTFVNLDVSVDKNSSNATGMIVAR